MDVDFRYSKISEHTIISIIKIKFYPKSRCLGLFSTNKLSVRPLHIIVEQLYISFVCKILTFKELFCFSISYACVLS